MSGRGGRDRFRRDYHALRIEDKTGSRTSNKINPSSRHLWVGNLSHGILEDDLTHHFLDFGELESVAFQPGRSYAFLNFRREDDAIAAMSALQGVPVAGNPLRIEFTKADKSSSRDEDYSQRRDELRSAPKESSFSEREFRAHNASPDPFYADKSNVSDKNVEPSSVLWIGFPALLKVDELILSKAFEPFGEIEKITAFPGRSFAFVQFSSIMSACKAKETLQGKLFGNPRVHICFAKSQTGLSNSGRSLMNASPSLHSNSNVHPGSTGNFSQDRSFGSLPADLTIRSPQSFPDLDAGDSDAYSFNRKRTSWTDGSRTFQNRRFGEVGADLGVLQDTYEHSSSPTREGHTQLDDYSKRFVELSPSYEDAWDLPEDVHFYPGAKKLKSDSFTRKQDLLEHSFSDFEQQKYIPKAYSDFLQPEAFDKNFEAAPFGYKQTPDHRPNVALPHADRSDHWGESYDIFKVGSDPLPSNPTEKNRFTPESDQSSLNEWKWEGTIAKGGNPVCRARCFPVGRVLDIMLPEFLDCTARTGLDMLSKHYFQAANAWVVFFVPESDAHIGFYNEFMHYLEEKQRAAVSKLDEKTTLFLVPPSEFSEKVLKVPGNLSISGVVLRLDHSGSNFGSLHYQNEKKNSNLFPINWDTSYTKPSTSLLPIRTLTAFPDLGKSGVLSGSFAGNAVTSGPSGSSSGSAYIASGVSHSYIENKHDYRLGQGSPILGQNFSSPHHQNSDAGGTNGASQPPNSADIQEHHPVLPNSLQETNSGNYRGIIAGISLSGNRKPSLQETQTAASVPLPMAAAPPTDQISQLASSLLGQQRLLGSTPDISMGDEFRQINTMNESHNSTISGLSASLSSQDHQLRQLQQQTGPQQSELLQNNSAQAEAETDPQKRLQATLQLAAALLQQIQQGK